MAAPKKAKGKPKIKIDPTKQGSLRRIAGVAPNQGIPVAKLRQLTKHSDKTVARKAQFALNARKFKHQKKS